MHVFCGHNFGDIDGEKELRRCKKHDASQKKQGSPKKKDITVSRKTTAPVTRGAKLQSQATQIAAAAEAKNSKRKEVPASAAGPHDILAKKKTSCS